MINGLPQRLKELRTQMGLSQRAVAKQLDLSPSIISGYETGERTPSAEVILALSYLYRCSTDYLLGKEKDQGTVIFNTNGLSPEQIRSITMLIDTLKK